MTSRCVAGCALALAILVGPGCLYLDRINQRPGIEILQLNPGPLYRGAQAQFEALVSDPDGNAVELVWRASACTSGGRDCDAAADGASTRFDVRVPFALEGGQRVEQLRVVLTAKDSRGAEARPAQELVLDVRDVDPTVTDLTVHDPKRWILGQKITACARHQDVDDPPSAGLLLWTVTDPSGRAVVLEDGTSTSEPNGVVECKSFVATALGRWRVVAAVRAKPTIFDDEEPFIVEDDSPCLALLAPAPARLLLDTPRRFSVLQVEDALDPYPGRADPPFGAARFSWSVLAPSAGPMRRALVGAGNYVELDPLAFAVGETVELRVEIADRRGIAPSCPDAAPTCAAVVGCVQRQTWTLEVR